MGELGVAMHLNVVFHALPVAVVIADLFAPGADREKTSQSPHAGQRLLQLRDELLALGLVLLALADVAEDEDAAHNLPVLVADGRRTGVNGPAHAVLRDEGLVASWSDGRGCVAGEKGVS